MTTVVFKDGVFAADSQVTYRDQIEGFIKKIIPVGSNYVIGFSGSLQAVEIFKDFLLGKEVDKTFFDKEGQDFEAIVADKQARKVQVYCKSSIPEKYEAPFYVVGSGSSIAKGALLTGATPKQAVQAAATLDIYTGGKINTVKVW